MKHLDAKGKGEYSYDYSNDIVLFKTKGREYSESLEYGDVVVDLDSEGFLTGLQVFDASRFFKIPKSSLREIKQFSLSTHVFEGVIRIKLRFSVSVRNKMVEQAQDFTQKAEGVMDSEVVCTV